MKKRLAILLAAVLFLLSGCTSAPSQPQETNTQEQSVQTPQAGIESVSLYPAAAAMPVERELKLKATVSPAGAAVTWSSNDEAVATVDSSGKVTAKVGGMVTISGTMTMEAMGQSITMPFGVTETSSQPFTICIYPSGDAALTFPLMARDGFDRNWVEGMLTKRPLM